MINHRFIVGSLTSLLFAFACSRDAGEPKSASDDSREAEVKLQSAEGAEIEGEATLREDSGGVRITLKVKDAPAGEKGVHIHEIGDCSDIAGKSMGEHFSPGHDHHALPTEQANAERHLGDMGNIRVNETGDGTLEFVIDKASLQKGAANSLIGRSLVVHEGRDQGESVQPSGGSGKPIACGVIEES